MICNFLSCLNFWCPKKMKKSTSEKIIWYQWWTSKGYTYKGIEVTKHDVKKAAAETVENAIVNTTKAVQKCKKQCGFRANDKSTAKCWITCNWAKRPLIVPIMLPLLPLNFDFRILWKKNAKNTLEKKKNMFFVSLFNGISTIIIAKHNSVYFYLGSILIGIRFSNILRIIGDSGELLRISSESIRLEI